MTRRNEKLDSKTAQLHYRASNYGDMLKIAKQKIKYKLLWLVLQRNVRCAKVIGLLNRSNVCSVPQINLWQKKFTNAYHTLNTKRRNIVPSIYCSSHLGAIPPCCFRIKIFLSARATVPLIKRMTSTIKVGNLLFSMIIFGQPTKSSIIEA